MGDIARSISSVLAMCAAPGVWFTCVEFSMEAHGASDVVC